MNARVPGHDARMKPLIAATALTTAALASLGLGAGAASANVSAHFNLTAGTEHTPGKARAVGAISYLGPKKFDISGRIDDICPKDGYGAYLYVEATFADGSRKLMRIKKDARDCDARGTVPFSVTRTLGREIKMLNITVQEEDRSNPDGLMRAGDVSSMNFWPDGRTRKL
jgi:hypothetical protein